MKGFLVIAVLNAASAGANAAFIENPINAVVALMCLVCAGVNFWCYADSKGWA